MAGPLDLAGVLKQDAAFLKSAREKALLLHPSDIKAAGNEVEDAVRDYFRRVLPQPFYVTSGHLIDSKHELSSQIDVIIADASNLPSLYTARDGTEYIPITSVYAIGEVKSTYFKSKRYFDQMKKALAKILEMDRPLVKNTAFGGGASGRHNHSGHGAGKQQQVSESPVFVSLLRRRRRFCV